MGCRLEEPFLPVPADEEGSWKMFNEDGRAAVALNGTAAAFCLPLDLADLDPFYDISIRNLEQGSDPSDLWSKKARVVVRTLANRS